MPKATPEEIDLLAVNFPKFVDETRKNFGAVNDSFDTFEKKLDEIYKKIGLNISEVQVLAGNVTDATKKIKNQTKEITESNQDLQKEIAGSTRTITKETEAPKKRWWQVWNKKKGG